MTQSTPLEAVQSADEANEQIRQRREKLAEMRAQGEAYPNDFKRDSLAAQIHERFADDDKAALEQQAVQVAVAGRIMSRRIMGKASFTHIQDVSGQIQLYVTRDGLPEGKYAEFKKYDIGDLIGATGTVYRTNKGELSVNLSDVRLLAKSLRPLPEKYHGITHAELRYRQRYVDLIVTEKTRDTFRKRSAIISYIRRYMTERDYLEVETPMMHVIPGGAVARPFTTHHNTLDMDLYLRIAPELYLKRLVVGGFEKVFEINRSFRNEGISTQHNPEFTMMECYEAYADFVDSMDMTEDLIRQIAANVLEKTNNEFQGQALDYAKPFKRMTMAESVLAVNKDMTASDLHDSDVLAKHIKAAGGEVQASWGKGKLLLELFEKTVERDLIEPTFITQHPVEVSPLSRRCDDDPENTDRFELFIAGREIANGFSELNDPDDQAQRFHEQVKAMEDGDNEAMHFDADYIRALEYGMPPAAGLGLGIDRLVMLFTDNPSIRDVLLFPHMRPESDQQ